MVRNKSPVWGAIGLTAAIIVLLFLVPLVHFLVEFGLHDSCRYSMVKTVRSPNSPIEAVLVRSGCGATTPFVMQVHLRDSNKKIDYNHDSFFSVVADNGVDVEWVRGENSIAELSIGYSLSQRVVRKAVVWDGIKIRYAER